MRSTLATLVLATGLTSLVAAHGQHDHDHVVDTKEPFIGWTQEDLDAKWGTDV
jgi:agmatinase